MTAAVSNRVRTKICGITRACDAIEAVRAGCDAIGVILHAPGRKREVNLETAQTIFAGLPAFVARVGVFVDAPHDVIVDRALKLQLSHVQLHGNETPGFVDLLSPISVIKAVTVAQASDWIAARPANLAALLIDAHGGGHGQANDWDAVEDVLRDRMDLPMISLAGGLAPHTVGEVARRFAPLVELLALDVSSGVEGDTVGVKDAQKIREFVRNARA
jgi:phosphoribosylanthranilate isomerase